MARRRSLVAFVQAPAGAAELRTTEPRETDVLNGFADLSTPLVADACVPSGVALRAAPPGISAVVKGHKVAGRVLPVRHYGSVDMFLEAVNTVRCRHVRDWSMLRRVRLTGSRSFW